MMRLAPALLTIGLLTGAVPPQNDLPPAFPREGITKAFENDRVVVWQGLVGIKSRPTAMHRHALDLVGVFLDDDARSRVRLPDGTVRDSPQARGRGDVVFQPGGLVHIEEFLGDGIRAVGIELKDKAGTPATSQSGAFPRAGATLLLDNERVSIWDYQWKAGLPVSAHTRQRDAVVVVIESGALRVGATDRQTRLQRLTFGEVFFQRRGAAEREEAAEGTPRVVVVELKGSESETPKP